VLLINTSEFGLYISFIRRSLFPIYFQKFKFMFSSFYEINFNKRWAS